MKIKILFINVVAILILISLIQVVFSIIQVADIPPYARQVKKVYTSGYFDELEKSFLVIRDSFLRIKTDAGPQQAWIFLADIQKKYGISVSVFNSNGQKVEKPGFTGKSVNSHVLQAVHSFSNGNIDRFENGKYISLMPVLREKKCLFCHRNKNKQLLGVLRFSRKYDSFIYFSAEKLWFFTILFVVLIILLYFIIKWEPGRNIKELFDKK